MQKPNYLLRTATISLLLTLLMPFNGICQSVTDASASHSGASSTYYVLLSDTVNVSQIETQLGSSSGQSDILNHIFDYDVSTGLPSGYTYSRQGNKLFLGVSSLTANEIYYGTVRVKNTSGTWSSAYSFITN